MDLSDLLQTNSSGLLNQPQQGDVNSQTLMGIAAGLLKASGPSPYKARMTTLSGIGDALQGGLAARKSAFDDILKQKLVAAQTAHLNDDQVLKAAQMATNFTGNNLPVPPVIQHILDAASGRAGIGGGPPGMPQGGAYAQAQPAPGGAAPGPAPAAPQGFPQGSPAARLQGLGISPFALAATGPAADIAKSAVEANVKATDPAISANERQKKIMESDIAADAKLYPIYNAMGASGHAMLQNANLSQALIKDAGFTSGIFQPIAEAWGKLKVGLGAGDPKATLAMEAFGKVTAQNINDQMGEVKEISAEMGPGGARVFKPQLDLMREASAKLGNTPEANYFLATMYQRNAQNLVALSTMADDYKQKHGILDVGFNKQVKSYLGGHPVISADELKDVRNMASPAGGIAASPSGAPATPAPAPATPSWAPPGAKQAPDGNYYVQQNGNWYRVSQ